METILSIDLATATPNSAMCVIQDRKPYVVLDATASPISPSVVTASTERAACWSTPRTRNRALLARPDRPVKSINTAAGVDGQSHARRSST